MAKVRAIRPAGNILRELLRRRLVNGETVYDAPPLEQALAWFEESHPYCGTCPACHAKHPGQVNKKCKACRGRGWVTRKVFEACPADQQEAVKALAVQAGPADQS